MKKTVIIVLGLFMVLQSCSSVHKTMREPNVRVELEKEDFDFSSQLSGEAHTQTILGIDWNRLFKKEGASIESDQSIAGAINVANIPVVGSVLFDPTSNYALYDLMTKNPGYDVVFYPQYVTKVRRPVLGIGFIYKETNVVVTAKLAKIKK